MPYDSPLARQISDKGGYYTPDGSLLFRRKSFPASLVADLLRDAESPSTARRRSPVDDWTDFSKTLIEAGPDAQTSAQRATSLQRETG